MPSKLASITTPDRPYSRLCVFNMVVRDRFELSAIDNLLPRYFHGGVSTFRLKNGVSQQQVLTTLGSSLDRACEALPFLTRRAFSIPPTPENGATGRMEAREHKDWKPVVEHNDLSDKWPDYDELVEDGLPQDLLDGTQLLPSSRFQTDLHDSGTPLLVAQANFVEGGLLLGVAMFHGLMDGMSMAMIYRTWAQYMRLEQGEETTATIDAVPGPECFDYQTLVNVWKDSGSPVAEPTPAAWRLLGLLPPRDVEDALAERLLLPGGNGTEAGPPKPPPSMSTGIFYVSAARIKSLSAVAATSSEPGATANDALIALLWRCIMRSRRAAAPDAPCFSSPGATSEMDMPLNGRALLSDVLPWKYMGTVLFYAMASMPVDDLVSTSTPLGDVVGVVRRSVDAVTRERAMEAYGLAATKVVDFCTAALRRPMPTFEGAEFGVTSSLSLPIMEWSFGSRLFANNGTPDYFRQERRLFDQVCRYCSVGSLRREGGVEITISLAVEEMEFLEKDSEFSEFAQLICH